MESRMDLFAVQLIIRGRHIYKVDAIEVLVYHLNTTQNCHDPMLYIAFLCREAFCGLNHSLNNFCNYLPILGALNGHVHGKLLRRHGNAQKVLGFSQQSKSYLWYAFCCC